VYQGSAPQLTVSHSDRASTMPPRAATRVSSPSAMPMPTAISAKAINRPKAKVWSATGPSKDRIGLALRTAASVACSDAGDDGSRKRESAILEMPAYRYTTARKPRSGSSAQPIGRGGVCRATCCSDGCGCCRVTALRVQGYGRCPSDHASAADGRAPVNWLCDLYRTPSNVTCAAVAREG
jgi:hypothetical protein